MKKELLPHGLFPDSLDIGVEHLVFRQPAGVPRLHGEDFFGDEIVQQDPVQFDSAFADVFRTDGELGPVLEFLDGDVPVAHPGEDDLVLVLSGRSRKRQSRTIMRQEDKSA